MREFMAARGLKPHPWATRAGVASGALYAFLKGETDSLSVPVLAKLAAVEGVPVAALIGEAEAPAPQRGRVAYVLRGDRMLPLVRGQRRPAPIPADARPDVLRIGEVQGGGMGPVRDGSLLYWHAPEPGADLSALIGRLCIVETSNGTVLADLRRGGAAGGYLLVLASGQVVEGAEVLSATPLEWVRPA